MRVGEWDEFDPADAGDLLKSLAAEKALEGPKKAYRRPPGGILGPPRNIDLILALSAYRCGICGGDLEEIVVAGKATGYYRFDVDHILPLVLGGRDTDENLQAAHDYCNQSKSGRFLDSCQLPRGSSSDRLRVQRKETDARKREWRVEYLRLIEQLGLNEYLAGMIELADGWQTPSYEKRAHRWKAWLAEIGPASQEARDYAASLPRPMGLAERNGVYCGVLMDDAFWSCRYYWHPEARERDRLRNEGGFAGGSGYELLDASERAARASAHTRAVKEVLDEYGRRHP
jgi:hypothetical protein